MTGSMAGAVLLDTHVLVWLVAGDTRVSLPGLRLAPLEPAIAVASSRLPGDPHGDPADRIIVATARHHGATLVTADDKLLAYGTAGHVKVLSAV